MTSGRSARAVRRGAGLLLAAWLLVPSPFAAAGAVAAVAGADSTRASASLATAASDSCDGPRLESLRRIPALQRTAREQAELRALEDRCAAWHDTRVAQGREHPHVARKLFNFVLATAVIAVVGVFVLAAQHSPTD